MRREEGRKCVAAYFNMDFRTVEKNILSKIKDRSIYYKTKAGKHVFMPEAYEKKYGDPRQI